MLKHRPGGLEPGLLVSTNASACQLLEVINQRPAIITLLLHKPQHPSLPEKPSGC